MRNTRYLALDFGFTGKHYTGWASWDGRNMDSGLLDFSLGKRTKRPHGQLLNELREWLCDKLNDLLMGNVPVKMDTHDTIVYEQPFQRGHTGVLHLKAAGVVDQVARERGLRCVAVPPKTLKLWATGDGGASKEEMRFAACRVMNYAYDPVSPMDDNRADALLLAAYGREQGE